MKSPMIHLCADTPRYYMSDTSGIGVIFALNRALEKRYISRIILLLLNSYH